MREQEEELSLLLIPGLPDEIVLECLVRVPHRSHSSLRPVCRRWRDLLTSPSFYHLRNRARTAEDLIFLVQALVPLDEPQEPAQTDPDTAGDSKDENNIPNTSKPPVYALTLYNATLDTWHRIPASIPMFSQIAAVPSAGGGKLVVVGGWDPVTLDPVADVLVLDLSTGVWRRGAGMSAARSFFACAAVGERIFVAGGHDGQKNALRSSEAYDVAADEWAEMPAMAEERDECQGVAGGGRFWAVSGYGTESQGRFEEAAEWYDDAAREWRKEEGMWGEAEMGGAAVWLEGEGGRVWRLGRREVREYEGTERGWKVVGKVPEGVMVGPCAAAIGGGERVFVMGSDGGEGGHGGWLVEAGSKKWRRVDTPVGFSGFVYSAAAVRL